MSVLMQASNQWRKRTDDERYTSLLDMEKHFLAKRKQMRSVVASSRKVSVVPESDNKGLVLRSPKGFDYAPSNWAFSQLCARVGAPAGYLAELPSPMAADCLNYGLVSREVEEIGLLLESDKEAGSRNLNAVTGPRYGRIWNHELLSAIIDRVGDGVSGQWKVPGEFGKAVKVTKANTTLFAGDRDMFIFLADEENRLTIPNRRDGKSGTLARGFWISNSEVGAKTLTLGAFLFDYVCCNRMVWGAQDYKELRIRHTLTAPDRWLEEVQPALTAYANSSAKKFQDAILDAQKHKLDKVDEFLATRYGRQANAIKNAFQLEEDRPIETRWDVATAVTAYAKAIPFQDERVKIERTAGELILAS